MVRRLDPRFVFIHCGGDTDRRRLRIVKRFFEKRHFCASRGARTSPATGLSSTGHQLASHHSHSLSQICSTAASFLLNKVRTAFITVNARRAAFPFHSSLSGLSQEITAPGEICRLAIVGPLISLFASWLVMRRGCRRGLGRRWRLQKKLQ